MSPMDWPQPDLKFNVAVGPGIDLEDWRLRVPAKAGCYLLTDDQGTPVLLGTAANMRNVLVHRLTAPPDEAEPTKRIDYRQVVRQIHFRPAFSRFETDWSYIANAKVHYTDQFDRLTRKWAGHWVHIDLTEKYPRFTTTRKPTKPGTHFGPLPTANAAKLFVETVTDLFDLCRYHEILRQSPEGQACAYKEMGKCPAPCDGTVTFESYREQLAAAHDMLDDLPGWCERSEQRMAAAAADLAFEQAGRIKAELKQASALRDAKYTNFAAMHEHRYLVIQPGSRKHHARAFLARPDGVSFLGEIIKRDREQQVCWLCDLAPELLGDTSPKGHDGIGLISWYLLRGEKDISIWLSPAEASDPKAVNDAIEQLATHNTPPSDDADEQSSDSEMSEEAD